MLPHPFGAAMLLNLVPSDCRPCCLKRVECTLNFLFFCYSSSLGGVHVSRMLRAAFVCRCGVYMLAARMSGWFCWCTRMPALSVLFCLFVSRSVLLWFVWLLFVSPSLSFFSLSASFALSASLSYSLSLSASAVDMRITSPRETQGLRP